MANKALIVFGGAMSFYDEYKSGEGLEQDERIINATVEAGVTVTSAVAIGALVGSVVPGAGTVVGAVAGFVVGSIVGYVSDKALHARVFNGKSAVDYLKEGANNLWDIGEEAVQNIQQAINNTWNQGAKYSKELFCMTAE